MGCGASSDKSLWRAAKQGDLAMARSLLAACANTEYNELLTSTTPLLIAASRGHADMVSLMIESGANMAARTSYEQAIHRAARLNHADVVRILLDAGVDVETPVTQVTVSNILLFSCRVKTTPLGIAAPAGHTEVVRLLLERRAKLDVGCIGKSLMHLANGLEAHEETQRGHTPLTAAAVAGHEGVVRALLQFGADAHTRVVNGLSARGCAQKAGKYRLVQIMDAEKDAAEKVATEAATLAALRRIPIISSRAMTEECVMCMEPLGPNFDVRQLACGHMFHPKCVDQWLQVTQQYKPRSCPICKADPVKLHQVSSNPPSPTSTISAI